MSYSADDYIKCDICEAPFRKQLAQGWSVVYQPVGRRRYVVIHKPSCPAGLRELALIERDDA